MSTIDQDAFDHDEQMFGPQVTPAELLSQARDVAERIIREAVATLPEFDQPARFRHNEDCGGSLCAHGFAVEEVYAVETGVAYSDDEPTFTLRAVTNGWDDILNEGNPMILECGECNGAWTLPTDLDWR